eukprot:COSAG04_NODE_280_length_18201_cov_5.871119_3_plen_266_part_00
MKCAWLSSFIAASRAPAHAVLRPPPARGRLRPPGGGPKSPGRKAAAQRRGGTNRSAAPGGADFILQSPGVWERNGPSSPPLPVPTPPTAAPHRRTMAARRLGHLRNAIVDSTPAAAANTTAQGEPVVWMNGTMVPDSQALVSIHDQSFVYGYGVFDTARASPPLPQHHPPRPTDGPRPGRHVRRQADPAQGGPPPGALLPVGKSAAHPLAPLEGRVGRGHGGDRRGQPPPSEGVGRRLLGIHPAHPWLERLLRRGGARRRQRSRR